MNKPDKCKNCQWYGKPYWSIINPCDSCPNENDYKTVIQVDGAPIIKEALTDEQIANSMLNKVELESKLQEKDKEIERLNNIINELEKELEQEIAIVGANRTVDNNNPEWWYKLNCYGNILDKLKELKEGK